MIVKPLRNEVLLTGNNALSVGGATLVRVTNISGSASQLVFYYANNVQYADMTFANGETVIVQKASTDKILATNAKACAIAYKG